MYNKINDLLNTNTLNAREHSSVVALKNMRKYKRATFKNNGNINTKNKVIDNLLKDNTDAEAEEIKKLLSLDCDNFYNRDTGDINTAYKDKKQVTKMENESYYPFVIDSPNYKESKENPFCFYSSVSDSIQEVSTTTKIVTPYVNEYTATEYAFKNEAMQKENLADRTKLFSKIGKIYAGKIARKNKISRFYNIEFVLSTSGKVLKTRKQKIVKISKAKVLSRAKATAKREALSKIATKSYIAKMLKQNGYNK